MRQVCLLIWIVAVLISEVAYCDVPVNGPGKLSGYGIFICWGSDDEYSGVPNKAEIIQFIEALPEELAHISLTTPGKYLLKVDSGLDNQAGLSDYAPFDLKTKTTTLAVKDISVSPDYLKQSVLYGLLMQYDQHYHISSRPEWRSLGGWRNRSVFGYDIPAMLTESQNQDPRGFSAKEGMASPSMDFVTSALEYFCPPPSSIEECMKCRVQEKYEYVKSVFNPSVSPLDNPAIQCRGIGSGFTDDLVFLNPDTGETIDIGPVNAETVIGFELLYATPGTGDASEIAGHLILRIRLANNPDADRLGIENPRDLVVSFLADTDPVASADRPVVIREDCSKNWFNLIDDRPGEDAFTSIVQSLRGLSGGFLTTMDRQTLGQAVASYTVDQDRDLLRYRLILTEKQKETLLDRLYIAKKSYKEKYYFFSQNCASVLARVIAQGVGDTETATFFPMVSPPHTLVGLLLRSGIAEPVYPSFYSYRKKGYVARTILSREYAILTEQYPEVDWPELSEMFHRNEDIRSGAVLQMMDVTEERPETDSLCYRFASMAQEAEMVYSNKDIECENYTGAVTADLRKFQQRIISRSGLNSAACRTDTNEEIRESFSGIERERFNSKSKHTGHYRFDTGAGYYHTSGSDGVPVVSLEGRLHHQDMGSPSAIAMQRGSSVDLGRVSLIAGGRDGDFDLKQWDFTGLKVRKFKDRLGTVPAFRGSINDIGLGLSALEMMGIPEDDEIRFTLAGGELLFNLIASENTNCYLFFSAGADLRNTWYGSGDEFGVGIPVGLEGLVSNKGRIPLQWRSSADYRVSLNQDVGDEVICKTSLEWLAGEFSGTQLTVSLSLMYETTFQNDDYDESRERAVSLLEVGFNRW